MILQTIKRMKSFPEAISIFANEKKRKIKRAEKLKKCCAFLLYTRKNVVCKYMLDNLTIHCNDQVYVYIKNIV